PRTALQPDTRHRFAVPDGPVTGQVRLDIYPDGGMARLRVLGRPTAEARAGLAERFLGALPEPQLAGLLRAVGLPPAGAARWAETRPGLDGLPLTARVLFGLFLSISRQLISVIRDPSRELIMAITFGDNQYGKAEVRLVHITRDGDRHQI